jgi:cytochrome c oxidase cbb3-type subunit I/II
MESQTLVEIRYDDRPVRWFMHASLIWGFIGMLIGLWAASELAWWQLNGGVSWLTFGRLRPMHTNGVIFAFAANAIFGAVYHSSQRLLKVSLPSRGLADFHFWLWQLIIVLQVVFLGAGLTQGKEYAEPEWLIDILITVAWVVFAFNLFWMIARRRERHIYVAIWFYIATVITIAVLHLGNNAALPIDAFRSVIAYSGVQDAMMQWWYGHNAVGFLLTTPFLGMMYYYLPKAAQRPVFSYRLSIMHFWALIFLYIWAGPHHLHFTALPDWAQSLGMVFSVMLWAPSWGGMVNGLMTLRGAFDRLREDPVLKFLIVAVTFYGMSTFEGPLMSIKSVNALSHYTDWTIGHVHSGALGWVAFLIFGVMYWLIPRLYGTTLYSVRAANIHFWTGTVGIVLYVVSMWIAGVLQGLMWQAFNADGTLTYPNFTETVTRLYPYYVVRVVGGTLFLTGFTIMLWNVWKTCRAGVPVVEGVRVAHSEADHKHPHRWLEARALWFSAAVTVVILIGGLIELLPTFLADSSVPRIASVKPYTPLEVEGRAMYVSEGCYTCHSQMVRPFRHETERYGEYSKAGEFIYDYPFQWGSKRTGPDLHRVGGKYPDAWHWAHMLDPRSTSPGSIMPAYPWLYEKTLDYGLIGKRVGAMQTLGVPYSDDDVAGAAAAAQAQAKAVADGLRGAGVEDVEDDRRILAMIAYLQRLGTDIDWRNNPTVPEVSP